MAVDLSSKSGLREACEALLEAQRSSAQFDLWRSNLSALLSSVQQASEIEFMEPAFQKNLWESDALSATGMGHVDVSEIVKSPELAAELWRIRQLNLPSLTDQRGALLSAELDQFEKRIAPLVKRNPRLKMYRVFAALHPADFTTMAHPPKLIELARAMGVKRDRHPVVLHRRVRDRFDEVLGAISDPLSPAGVERMMLAWMLFATHVQDRGEGATEVATVTSGESNLKPLPASRRRRGLLTISGGLQTILAMIEFAKDGCKREDFREHLRSINPKWALSSINTNINALIAEWGVLASDGDELRLTPRGEDLLETGDPEAVADWLLTRVLGVDFLLNRLRSGPVSQVQLIEILKLVNPGWTSNFAPTSMLQWFRGIGLAEMSADHGYRLTERGSDWASRISWEPEALASPGQLTPSDSDDSTPATGAIGLTRPALGSIISAFPKELRFADHLIARLDASLWSHPRRHFAVLTGLSGSGKTQLACCYARSLWQGEIDRDAGLLIVPVQPGWHDPSSLLGYVNPLDSDVYVRTAFLEFLLDAQSDPDRPYTVVLDEMNLSHPEQYLAPLLSTMETGDPIELHASGDDVGGVPSRVSYPSNLLIIGTVNMDETTHGLSDKVLDRAGVLEFWDIDVDAFPGWGTAEMPPKQIEAIRSTLRALMACLLPARLHFGWRTIADVIGYVREATRGGVIGFESALDQAVYAKILPKLRGDDSQRFRQAIGAALEVLRRDRLTDSAEKLTQLQQDLTETGSARFWR